MDISTSSSNCRHFIHCQLCHCRAAELPPGKEALLLFLSCDSHSTAGTHIFSLEGHTDRKNLLVRR